MTSPSLLFLFWVNFFLLLNPNSPTTLSKPRNITLFGDAHLKNGAISLTQERTCPPSNSSYSSYSSSNNNNNGIGRALYSNPIRFLDSSTETTASFSSTFSFSITPTPLCPSSGEGLAFLITSNPGSLSHSDGYIGLPGLALSPQDSFVAFEFDTNLDSSIADINANHVGIDVNTAVSFASADAGSVGIHLQSGRTITTWIDYSDSAKLAQVWISYSSVRPPSPILVARVDLSEHFKEFMHIGFSASNGKGSALHFVDHWRFRVYGYLGLGSPIDEVGDGDCLFCHREESGSQGNQSLAHQGREKMEGMALELGGLAAILMSIIVTIFVVVLWLLRRKKSFGRSYQERQTCGVNRVPMRLSIDEIKSATMGFNRNRIVGKGGSATVYKGSLPSSGAVAVKRFERATIDCSKNPFVTEFATVVGCLRHKNLVQLQGWCCEGAELVLVYEYLPNGSLDKILHKTTNSAVILSWQQRLNIVLGVASALSYLHEECERQIIHRDIKACNIMLDADFNAKLGDFGLAEVYEHSSMTREATIPAGTMGYLAPEYIYSGVPTEKTDVYSFGVVVLEVASGKRPVDDDGKIVLVDVIWRYWEEGRLIEAADIKLNGNFDGMDMQRMLMVGLVCVHPNSERRPTIKEAARILMGEAPLPLLPARKPRVRFQSALLDELGEDPSSVTDDVPWMTPMTHFG